MKYFLIVMIFFSFGANLYTQSLEYFWDTDPGFGSGVYVPSSQTNNFYVPLDGLSEGFHAFYVRAFDSGGWSLYIRKPIYIFEGTSSTKEITALEYYWDEDPGVGLGASIPIVANDTLNHSFSIPMDDLSEGFHTFYIRAKDELGNWSLYTRKPIYVFEGTSITKEITTLEYYWDEDPGVGLGASIPIVANDTLNHSFSIPMDDLSEGSHTFYIRAKDQLGNWSLYTRKPIYVFEGTNLPRNLVAIEYFYDIDPGIGNGESIAVGDSSTINQTFIFPLLNLTHGEHELYVRAKDDLGNWSLYTKTTVFVEDWQCEYVDAPPIDPVYLAATNLCNLGILDNDGLCEPDDSINRASLAKIAYLSIGLQDINFVDSLPCPFNDLQKKEEVWYYSYAKALSYLEYTDNTSPFDRDYFNFRPSGHISKAHALKVFLETWNIDETVNSGVTPFVDEGLEEHHAYNYIVKAYDLGLIDDNPEHLFEPNEDILRREAFIILNRMITTLTVPNILNNDFFIPGNYTPLNFAFFDGMHSGNFSHYTKNSFQIASIGLPLTFSHSYNSYLSEMPDELIAMRPLGKMWNHSFNSYLQEIDGDKVRPNDFRIVVALPNSEFHVYKKYSDGYIAETEGVYNILTKINDNKFTIKTKKQITYTYEKIIGTPVNYPFVLTKISDRNDNGIELNYESSDVETTPGHKRIKEVIGTAGRKLLFTYLPNSDLLESVIDPIGRTITFDYISNQESYLMSFTDAKGQVTSYNYGMNEEKDLLLTIQLPKGNVITNTYEGKKIVSTKTNENQPTVYTYQQNYDQDQNFMKTTIVTPDNQQTVVEYNKKAVPSKIEKGENTVVDISYSSQFPDKVDVIMVNDHSVNFGFDQVGNVVSVTKALGVVEQYTYTSLGDIDSYTDAKGNIYSYAYDSDGNLISFMSPRGTTSFIRDDKGLIISIINPEGIETNFLYDDYGNIIETTKPENIVNVANFDLISRQVSKTNPNGIVTSFSFDLNDNLLSVVIDSIATNYAFDENDNLIKITNAKGSETSLGYSFSEDFLQSVSFENYIDSYTYFSDGKLNTATTPNQVVFSHVYNQDNKLISKTTTNSSITYTYDEYGNIVTMTNEHGTIMFVYDELNRVISTVDYYGNIVGYEYDLNSNIIKIIYPGNKEVLYTYYNDNLLSSVTDWNGNTTNYTYRADGLLLTMSYPNGTTCNYFYDSAGRELGHSWKKSNAEVIAEYYFTLDPLGNHLTETKVEPFDKPFELSGMLTMNYSAANRIENTTNIIFDTDNNGNTIASDNTVLSYDVYDNLQNITGEYSASYEYDAANNRRRSVLNGTAKRYVLDILGMTKVLLETDDGNTPLHYYIYGLGLISRINASDETNYYHYDYRGSTVALTNENEIITHKYKYGNYGELLQEEELNENLYRYIGKYGVMYEANDLYFMRARYYNPYIGRFLSEDPIWTTNLYPYANNNPIMMVDPKGEKANILRSLHSVGSALTAPLQAGRTGWEIRNSKDVGDVFINVGAFTNDLYGVLDAGVQIHIGGVGSFFNAASTKIGVSSYLGLALNFASFGKKNYEQYGFNTFEAGGAVISKTFIQVGVSGLTFGVFDGEDFYNTINEIGKKSTNYINLGALLYDVTH